MSLRSASVHYAALGPIAVHLPEKIETNDQLLAENPKWDMDLIYAKTGIRARHIAAPGETASDLGVKAAEKLFREHDIDRSTVDFLLFCTQTPDYPLPTTACLMQHRLGLKTSCGALDFNLGCSGYIYGLGLAEGLIRSGSAKRILFITGETYSKYIHAEDRSLRTIFGDGAAATLIEAAETPTLRAFRYGTDGSGADMLLSTNGGARLPEDSHKPRKRQRWKSSLCMDGPALVDFTVENIPGMVDDILGEVQLTRSQIDYYLMHQATYLMMDRLRQALAIDEERMPLVMREYGNTVSSTIPIVIHDLRADGRLKPGMETVMVGFGVGLSWGGCAWTAT